jgi:hypothetical protein
MTIGTILLGFLEPNSKFKLSEKATYLAASYNTQLSNNISRTSVPIDGNNWNSILVHLIPAGDGMNLKCLAKNRNHVPSAHFTLTPEGWILISNDWVRQDHIDRFRGCIQIGVQMTKNTDDITPAQQDALQVLLKDLQARCNVQPSKIHLHSAGKSCVR